MPLAPAASRATLRRPSEASRRGGMDRAARRGLLYGVMPTWIAAGAVDGWHHRRTGIETTSGVTESAIHALMMFRASVPALLGLWCTGGLLGRARAHELRDWRLRSKGQPLTARAKRFTLAAVTVLGALTYAEEMLRCLRARAARGGGPIRRSALAR